MSDEKAKKSTFFFKNKKNQNSGKIIRNKKINIDSESGGNGHQHRIFSRHNSLKRRLRNGPPPQTRLKP